LTFEILTMRVRPDGFVLTFTAPVDPESAGNVASYTMETYDHIYQSAYGSPEVDQTRPTIKRAEVREDGMQVRLVIDGLVEGHIHELHASGVRSADSHHPLLHAQADYTLNYLPEAELVRE
jgi:hypothetical protein